MAKNRQIKNDSLVLFSIDELVPQDHLVRDLEEFIDWNFIYDICDPLYSDIGTNRIDPVVLFKLMMINIIFGYHSMRRTCEEAKVNIAYKWFLGLSFEDKVPDHSTFSQNYIRKFKDNDVSIKIFMHIISVLKEHGVIDLSTAFSDGTHVKANANKNRYENKEIETAAKLYHFELVQDVNQDRVEHNKKELKKTEPNQDTKNIKVAKNDKDCGYFHKGEKEKCFAYNVNTSCDRHGYILGSSIHPGNVHDSVAFFSLYNKLKCLYGDHINNHVLDAGYVTPAICKLVKDNEQELYVPYKRPMTKKGFFKKYEFVYDEYYDCYICPEDKTLRYSNTNKEGYKEYKSNANDCKNCPSLYKCTHSKECQKLVTRHIWESYKEEFSEELRHSDDWKEIYPLRKQTIERAFGDGKMNHGLDYTRYTGKEAVEFSINLIYTGMNIKKFVKHMARVRDYYAQKDKTKTKMNKNAQDMG